MSHDQFEPSPWDDVLSSNQANNFAGLDNHIANELSTTFQQTDIHHDNDNEGENEEEVVKEEEEEERDVEESKLETNDKELTPHVGPALTTIDSKDSDQSEVKDNNENDRNSDENHKTTKISNPHKDTSDILSSILPEDSESSPFRETITSPKKGEALFKEASKSLKFPESDEPENEIINLKLHNSTSPSKFRRQNVYRAPRIRRNPLKSHKQSEDADKVEVTNGIEPLGPLGTQKPSTQDEDFESAAETLLRESESPLFEINRTPLSPLKSQRLRPSPIIESNTTTEPLDAKPLNEDQQLEQSKILHTYDAEPSIKLEITVGDPIRVGDITSAHIVYSVRTKTNSELFTAEQTVVSRRYRDFRWLYRQLQLTHPGRIIPPPPDKQAVGRFNEDFIEGRRFALERMLVKISENPNLQKDPDFMMFLQSERFSSEAREREKIAATSSIFTDTDNDASLNNGSGGFLSSIGGAFSFTPKVTEPDEYFRDKRGYIESLDQQFKIFLRNLETVVYQRHDLSTVTQEFATLVTTLADLEISKTTTDLFQEFSNTQLRIKELLDRLSLQDMLTLGSTLDEYQRVIGSIRTIFQQREKILLSIATADHDLKKKQASLDKYVKYNSTQTEKINSLKLELSSLEQKQSAVKEHYDIISKTIKDELATFEIEKIHDFRNTIEIYLESTIESQKEAVELWETFYNNNLAPVIS